MYRQDIRPWCSWALITLLCLWLGPSCIRTTQKISSQDSGLREGGVADLVGPLDRGFADKDSVLDQRYDTDAATDLTDLQAAVDLPPDLQPCPAPVIRSVQSGTLVLSASETTVTVNVQPVVQEKSLLFISMRENEASPRYGLVLCSLETSSSISCQRSQAGTDLASSNGVITVHYYLAEFAEGVTVQRDVSLATHSPLTITAVDPSQSFVLLSGTQSSSVSVGWGDDEFTLASLTGSASLLLDKIIPDYSTAWQVVSLQGAKVQRGQLTMEATDTLTTVPLVPPVSLDNAAVLLSYMYDAAGDASALSMLRSALPDASTLQLRRESSGTPVDLAYEVVSLPYFVQSGTVTLPVGVASHSVQLSPVDTATSVAFACNQSLLGPSSGSTDFLPTSGEKDIPGVSSATLSLSDSQTLEVQRDQTGGRADLHWFVVDFGKPSCLSGY